MKMKSKYPMRQETRAKWIDVWRKYGSARQAAKALGTDERTMAKRFKFLRDEGLIGPLPTGVDAMPVAGTSTLLDEDGNVRLQWIKRTRGAPDPGAIKEMVKEAMADAGPFKRIPLPKGKLSKSLLTVIPIGDHHTGMYAWAEEAGEDYDLKIAERLLTSAASHLVDVVPACEECWIVNLGDFFHYDSHRAETPQNKNALDVDTRYAAMIRAGVRMMWSFIESALVKFKRVWVINSPGNHDPVGALWLSIALAERYANNPRVEIDQNPGRFVYRQHGKVLIGVTHGDTVKPDKLSSIMACDKPEMWGQTRHRYWLTGHIHNRRVIESPGCMVESFRTLATRDAWASAGGYRSDRDMTALVFHAEYGEVARHRFDVGMLE